MANNFDRQFLIQKLKEEPQNLANDEKAQIIEFINTKRYGLVWEDKPERAWEQMKDFIPVLEDGNKPVLKDTDAKKNPNHILIEGDNLHALTSLLATHEGKVDVIYIDPPYNTGKEFTYHDNYKDEPELIDKEHPFRHSTWLSFMKHRLDIAKRLLSDKGLIFISIDDNEQANLKLLCDEVFGETNFVESFFWNSIFRPSNMSKTIRKNGEYVLTYKNTQLQDLELVEEYKDPQGDASLTQNNNSRRTLNFPRGSVKIMLPNGLYPKGKIGDVTLLDDVYVEDNYSTTDFRINGKFKWRQENLLEEISRGVSLIIKTANFIPAYRKTYQQTALRPTKIINREIVKDVLAGGAELDKIVGDNVFSYPKPTSLIKFLLNIRKDTQAIVLDFFAGSGTTLHATMQLNAEDGGHRQCILVQSPDKTYDEKDGETKAKNGAESAYKAGYLAISDITYERNRRVIEGYTKPNGEYVEGLQNNNLRYYRTRFVPREKDLTNIERFARQSVTLLNIKHDAYNEQDTFGELNINKKQFRYFKDGDKQFLVILDIEAIEQITGELMDMEVEIPIPTYVFTTGHYPYSEDFWQVNKKVELYPYPTCIYGACEKEMPKMDDKLIDQDENIELTEDEANFSYEDLNKE